MTWSVASLLLSGVSVGLSAASMAYGRPALIFLSLPMAFGALFISMVMM